MSSHLFNLCLNYVIENTPYIILESIYVTRNCLVDHLQSEIARKRGRLLVICALIVLNLNMHYYTYISSSHYKGLAYGVSRELYISYYLSDYERGMSM